MILLRMQKTCSGQSSPGFQLSPATKPPLVALRHQQSGTVGLTARLQLETGKEGLVPPFPGQIQLSWMRGCNQSSPWGLWTVVCSLPSPQQTSCTLAQQLEMASSEGSRTCPVFWRYHCVFFTSPQVIRMLLL